MSLAVKEVGTKINRNIIEFDDNSVDDDNYDDYQSKVKGQYRGQYREDMREISEGDREIER